MTKIVKSLQERFEERVFHSPCGCWIWTGARYGSNYGKLWMTKRWEQAHRISYKLYKGEIPKGLFVLHHCDYPPCVNPYHLFLGTNLDNSLDRESKGRGVYPKPRYGKENYNTKLTEECILKIIQLGGEKMPQRKIAKLFNIKQSTVCKIIHRKIWTHIAILL